MKYAIYCRKSSEAEDRQVLSIESQIRELRRSFGELEIVDTLTEARTAKEPGRPVFNLLMQRVERGEIQGIIAWHPDRLARNSIDGGRIVYGLDTEKLKDLKFATFSFENNPQGKFMLAIAFGYSKYYSDALSVNVKRGRRTKVENGWLPGTPPIGYLNDSATHTIVTDPARFALVRKMWDQMLTGRYSVHDVWRLADEWGLRTVQRKRIGGKPLSLSAVYQLLKNGFYAGILRLEGRAYPGKHQAMVSISEFDQVQRALSGGSKPRPQRKMFPYIGLLRCGECGFAVTAEDKVNRFGSQYTYYHCSKRRPYYRCCQQSVSAKALDEELRRFIEVIAISPQAHEWAMRRITRAFQQSGAVLLARSAALAKAQNANRLATKNLLSLRIKNQITDDQFSEAGQELDRERIDLERKLAAAPAADPFEPERILADFSFRALQWFDRGDGATKREIVEIVGSNPILNDQRVKVDAASPFRRLKNPDDISTLRGRLRDVRTLKDDPVVSEKIARMKALIEKLEPDLLKKAA